MLKSNQIAECYRESLRYELRVDFEGLGEKLEECVEGVGRDWKREGEKCLGGYERGVRRGLEGELSRVLGNIKN